MRGRCENCYHAVPDEANPTALTCRLNPPVPHPIGGKWHAVFPPVMPEWGCGQFTVRDMLASFSPRPYVAPEPMLPPKPAPVDPVVERIAHRLAWIACDYEDQWRDHIANAEEIIAMIKPVENPEGQIDPA